MNLIAVIAFLLGLTLGVGVMWFRPKRSSAVASPGPQAVAARAVPFPLEAHLVFNVLNRLAIALMANERSQEGAALLGDYLRASILLQRQPDLAGAESTIRAYWSLMRWNHAVTPETLAWEVSGTFPADRCEELTLDMTNTLRKLEDFDFQSVKVLVNGGQPIDAPLGYSVVVTGLQDAGFVESKLGGWIAHGPNLRVDVSLPASIA